MSGGGQQVQQFFEPQTFDEPPSVVNQMNDDYFDSQVVNHQAVMGMGDRPVIDRQLDFILEWSEISGQWSVQSQRS